MSNNKTVYNCKNLKVTGNDSEDIIGVPKPVEFDDNSSKISLKDKKIKEFIELCNSLENTILQLTREYGHIRSNEEYFQFKQEITKHKNKTIIEAYNNGLLEWKF